MLWIRISAPGSFLRGICMLQRSLRWFVPGTSCHQDVHIFRVLNSELSILFDFSRLIERKMHGSMDGGIRSNGSSW